MADVPVVTYRISGPSIEVNRAAISAHRGARLPNGSAEENPAAEGAHLASHQVPVATPEQAARDTMNPWILLKMKALGELMPRAGIDLEKMLDQGERPQVIANRMLLSYGVRLSTLEIARYGSWLPEIRRDAMRRAEDRSECLVNEFRRRRERRR